MEVVKERGEKRASSNKTVLDVAKERAYMAAKARHENYIEHRTAHKERIAELQNTHSLHHQHLRNREAELMRAHSAKERDLRHQLEVVKGHVQRGQASASAAPTIAYPARSAVAGSVAPTIAYPANAAKHSAPASSKTSGTEAALSVSRSRTRHSQSPEVMKAFENHGRRRSPDLSHVRPGLPLR
jgi:hypothetical protein